MRRLLALFAAMSLAAPALAANEEPLPASTAEFTGTDWLITSKSGKQVEVTFLPQGKALVTYDKRDWAGSWSAAGPQVTVTVRDRGGISFSYDTGNVRGALTLTGADGPLAAITYRGKPDLDRQIYAQQLTYAPCEWINEAVRITARKSVLSQWAMNGMAFAMQGYDNAKRSELRNRLIVARAGKGKGFGAVKQPYLAFHRMLETCAIRQNGRLYPLEGLVRLKKDGESKADQVYSYFHLRGGSGALSEIEIVIYADWYSGTPFAVLDVGTGDSAFPNHSSWAVRHDFRNGWQPFGVQPQP